MPLKAVAVFLALLAMASPRLKSLPPPPSVDWNSVALAVPSTLRYEGQRTPSQRFVYIRHLRPPAGWPRSTHAIHPHEPMSQDARITMQAALHLLLQWGLTQVEFARYMGMLEETLSALHTGRIHGTWYYFDQIMKGFRQWRAEHPSAMAATKPKEPEPAAPLRAKSVAAAAGAANDLAQFLSPETLEILSSMRKNRNDPRRKQMTFKRSV